MKVLLTTMLDNPNAVQDQAGVVVDIEWDSPDSVQKTYDGERDQDGEGVETALAKHYETGKLTKDCAGSEQT